MLKPFETLRGAMLFIIIGSIVIHVVLYGVKVYFFPDPSPIIIQRDGLVQEDFEKPPSIRYNRK